uniref:3-deoxy-manno-octulosonate cytidylyltransferase n=1 Tax=Magnetococcus massalia (strain MO-1) TaxID=451514 RepID=A0A1S7LFV9_MAGMO|nr:3-deoxy-manno-octulosonate cytidylyltransferase [Candidatus Magnetococcus massalia]
MSDQDAVQCLAVIPARWASSRFPGKPVTLIAGKMMIERVWQRTCQASHVDAVVVATDDTRIAEACEARGIPWVMTASDHATGTDRLAEVAQKRTARFYLNVQGDEPLIDPQTIDAVAKRLINAAEQGIEVATAYMDGASEEQKTSPSTVHLVPTLDQCVLTFSRLPVPHPFQAPFDHKVHVGLYGYTKASLERFAQWSRGPVEQAESIEPLRFLERGERIACVPVPSRSIGVDHPEDVVKVEAMLRERGLE